MVTGLFKQETTQAQNYERGHPHFVLGLDLGQSSDPTALVVTERKLEPDGPSYTRETYWGLERRQPTKDVCVVRHMGRPPLRTPYTEIADGVIARIKALCRGIKDPYVVLIVDATGVG